MRNWVVKEIFSWEVSYLFESYPRNHDESCGARVVPKFGERERDFMPLICRTPQLSYKALTTPRKQGVTQIAWRDERHTPSVRLQISDCFQTLIRSLRAGKGPKRDSPGGPKSARLTHRDTVCRHTEWQTPGLESDFNRPICNLLVLDRSYLLSEIQSLG